jgi:ribonuclease T2
MQNQRIVVAALFLLIGCKATEPPAATVRGNPKAEPVAGSLTSTGPQPFDYYLLNLSWSPEFCHSHPNATECTNGSRFVLHGLWPQNNDGTYPQNCSNALGPTNPSRYADIYPEAGLLEHEWRTHGTCSGLSPDAFFDAARSAFRSVAIPPELNSLTRQISLSPMQILGLFTTANASIPHSSLALSCGNNYLTAVEVCLDKQLHPTACGPIRSCRANSVRIPPPSASLR